MRGARKPQIHGWLILDKPVGIGSTQALSQVRKALGVRKAGHGGTLDPLASGVLPIALGHATRTVALAMAADKEYEFSIDWGVSTDTLDAAGEITARSLHRPGRAEISDALGHFVGEVEQQPPRYSAIKVNGKRAYDLARAGVDFALPARAVSLYEAEVLAPVAEGITLIRICCGKGFYVRALARDLAQRLGTEGHVASLRRTRVGCFSLRDAKTLEKIAKIGNKDGLGSCLIPIRRALAGIPVLRMSGEDSSSIRHGRHVAVAASHHSELLRSVGTALLRSVGGGPDQVQVVLAVEDETAVALGEIRGDRFHPTCVFGSM